MHKRILFGRIRKRILGKLFSKEMIEIEADTAHSFDQILLDMEEKGYIEFLNPRTGETLDFDSVISLYMEQLETELKGS